MTGCMCAECKYWDATIDNHGKAFSFCVCRESEYFLHEIHIAFDNCDFGIVDDYGEEEGE